MNKSDLSLYNNSWYKPGANAFKRVLWYFVNGFVFNSSLFPFSNFKVKVLRLFGAKIGKSCIIKPSVNIKYPWKLTIGDYTWIGEMVWIDNLGEVQIGSHVCLSQGAMLLCGNHNYTHTGFDLMVDGIRIEEGAWIGAKALVCPGVKVSSHAVLSAGSIAVSDLNAYGIYQGNPAEMKKQRVIKNG